MSDRKNRPPRAWHKKKKKMRDVSLLLWAKDGSMCVGTNEPYSKLDDVKGYYHGKDVVLLYPTGLQDREGKEIYEGDVVEYDYQPGKRYWNCHCKGVVSWKSTGFHFKPIGGGYCGWLISMPGAWSTDGNNELFKILGNKYQHPELLNQEGK